MVQDNVQLGGLAGQVIIADRTRDPIGPEEQGLLGPARHACDKPTPTANDLFSPFQSV